MALSQQIMAKGCGHVATEGVGAKSDDWSPKPLPGLGTLIACVLLAGACSSSSPRSTTVTGPSSVSSNPSSSTAPAPTSIQVGVLGNTPPTLEPGQSKQFWALGSYADGTTSDLTNTATWRTSNPVVATVSAGGMVTGGGLGHADITASVSSVTGGLGLDVGSLGCRYVVDPPRLVFSEFGGRGQVEVKTSMADCRWTVKSDASWFPFSYDPRVSGSGSFYYDVPSNSTPSTRTANLVVLGTDGATAVHSLEQARPITCSYVAIPDHSYFTVSGGSGSFQVVTTPADCRWNLNVPSYNYGPIHITGGFSGTGNGVVTFTVSASSYSPASYTIGIVGLSGQNPPGIHTVNIR